MSNNIPLCAKQLTISKFILLREDESEEEILAKLKTVPLDLSVKIAAAIGYLWEESGEDERI